MTELTREDMEDLLLEHEKAELEFDLDATMATLCPNPHFELCFMGLAVDGYDAVRAMYQRMLFAGGEKRNIQAVARVVAAAPNALVREAHVSFDDDDGTRVTGVYIVTIEFDPVSKKIKGERMFGDTIYGGMMSRTMGADYAAGLPGVTKISDSAPMITRHDAFDAAAARGITINNPRVKA